MTSDCAYLPQHNRNQVGIREFVGSGLGIDAPNPLNPLVYLVGAIGFEPTTL